MLLLNVFAICYFALLADAARILGVFPLPWGSHYFLGEKLMKGIAQAGHNVTFISPYPTENISDNFHDVILEGFQEQFNAMISKDDKLKHHKTGRIFSTLNTYAEWDINICKITLSHPNLKKLIASGETYDAVIISQGFGNDCFLALAYIFKGHSIIASSKGPFYTSSKKVANPLSISTVSNPMHDIPELRQGFGFIPRLKNLYYSLEFFLAFEWLVFPPQHDIVRELYPDLPSVTSLSHNVSLVLLNSHSSFSKAEPLVPNSVEIGGYHVSPPKQLPADLQEFLDSATEGAILFILGSVVKSKDLPDWKKRVFLDAFKDMKVKVLWKFEADLPGKPDNVLIRSWLPQQDILAHPNVKIFITHGGMLSSIEAVYHGVPVLCLPMFGDQGMNSNKAVEAGYGLKLEHLDDDFNADQLKRALQELLNNPRYSENANKLSKIFHDRPLTPMEAAVYWIEYVIRHNGARHLRVAGVGLPWYKYYMVDIVAVVLSGIFLAVYIALYLIKLIVSNIKYCQSINKYKVS